MASGGLPYAIKNIFSLASRERCASNLKKITVPNYGKIPTDSAAVLVPICKIETIPSLLYTIRSTNLRNSSGEVAFPGGKSDDKEDSIQTALRETFEEIGIPQDKIDVWCKGPAVPGRNNSILVTPVIGAIHDISPNDLKINEKEVSEVFTIPIEALCDSKNQYYTQFNNGFILPVFVIEDYKIWGITAYITHSFLSSTLTKDVYRNEWMKKKITIP